MVIARHFSHCLIILSFVLAPAVTADCLGQEVIFTTQPPPAPPVPAAPDLDDPAPQPPGTSDEAAPDTEPSIQTEPTTGDDLAEAAEEAAADLDTTADSGLGSTAGTGLGSTPNLIGDTFGGGQTITRVLVFNRQQDFPGPNPLGPDNPVGGMVNFSIMTGGELNQNTTVVSALPTATLNAQPGVDVPGFTFALQENTAFNSEVAATVGQNSQAADFVSARSTLVANGGAGIDVNDLYDLFFTYDILDVIQIATPSPGAGGVVGRTKIAEDNSPLPRDRIIFNYNAFYNVPVGVDERNVHRFSPGIERTFACGNMSLEARFPFASTLNSEIFANSLNPNHTEFGNIVTTFKHVWMRSENAVIAGGASIAWPTSDDVQVNLAQGTPLVRMENESIHVMPYIGWLSTPHPAIFHQGFVQLDSDVTGVPVFMNPDGAGLRPAGRIYDRTYLYIDGAVGCWIYESLDPCSFLQRVAPVVELHYTRSLNDGDFVTSGRFIAGDVGDSFELLNFVAGLHVQLGNRGSISAGYSTPIGSGRDRQFDHELRVIYNRLLGPRQR